MAKVLYATQKDIVEKALNFYFDCTDSFVADKIIDVIENKKIKIYFQDEAYKML